jgi:hypothetical protein
MKRLSLWGAVLVACIMLGLALSASAGPIPQVTPTPSGVTFGYTYNRPDGNRYVAGQGHLAEVAPLDVALDGVPAWVVSAPDATRGGTIWAVVLDNGQVRGFHVIDGTAAPEPIQPDALPPGMPPLLRVEEGRAALVVAPAADASPLTHPVVLGPDRMAYLNTAGEVVLLARGGGLGGVSEVGRVGENAAPDMRLVLDEAGQMALFGDATPAYDHGVLGDAIESQTVVLLTLDDSGSLSSAYALPGGQVPQVIEGLVPLWADLDGNGTRDVILTASDAQQGAQVLAFLFPTGQPVSGPPIGQGYRWRLPLAVAPFGPDGVLELVGVRVPHLGGVVEFYRLVGNDLQIVAEVPGYTAHVIGTRNLDMAVAGDFDADGLPELLLPAQDRRTLGGIQRTADGADVIYSLDVGAEVVTNLSAVAPPEGGLIAGVGRSDGVLRLWVGE